jgi:hypothetical protein
MTPRFSKVRPFHLIAVCALALGGCAGHSDFMVKVPRGTAPIAPGSNSATVVFIRDSGIGFAVNFSIIDHAGNRLGDAVAKRHFALQLAPGRYYFFARGGSNTDAVQADVAPGRLYYVRVVPHLGVWLARVELHPVKPSDKEWRSVPEWLAHTDRLTPVIPATAISVSDSPLPAWASKAWSALSPADQAARTLAPDDAGPLPPTPSTTPSAIVAASSQTQK